MSQLSKRVEAYNVASNVDYFFFVFLCAAIFFRFFFLVLDFFFNVSMDFSFDETREEMQKKIFYSWPQQTFFQLFFFFFFFFIININMCRSHIAII